MCSVWFEPTSTSLFMLLLLLFVCFTDLLIYYFRSNIKNYLFIYFIFF